MEANAKLYIRAELNESGTKIEGVTLDTKQSVVVVDGNCVSGSLEPLPKKLGNQWNGVRKFIKAMILYKQDRLADVSCVVAQIPGSNKVLRNLGGGSEYEFGVLERLIDNTGQVPRFREELDHESLLLSVELVGKVGDRKWDQDKLLGVIASGINDKGGAFTPVDLPTPSSLLIPATLRPEGLSSSIPEISVFLSSPSDVPAERQIIYETIQELNADPAWQHRCVVQLLAYEDEAIPDQMGTSGQRAVNEFMRTSCEADIVVCVFCNRMGTPTVDKTTGKEYRSGAYYEFETAFEGYEQSGVGPRLLIFLGSRDFPDNSSDEEHEQYYAARKFKKHFRSCPEYEGLYFDYRELNEFNNLVRIQLKRHLDEILPKSVADGGVSAAAPGLRTGLRAYLGQLAEGYRWLELQGIREAGTLSIELEKVYVALKAEPESEYELQLTANLHAVEVTEEAGVDSIEEIDSSTLEQFDAANLRRTYRPSREQAKRATITKVHTLGDAFRQHRRLVILGDPGTGKTTLGRWLVLQLASAMTRQLDTDSLERVKVPVSQIDPDAPAPSWGRDEFADLGPARLPIFLRLAHFSRELAFREQQKEPSLPLIDYLGHDPDSLSLYDGFTPEARNGLFRSTLKDERAVVILDGLDELAEANRRDVVLKIQAFVEEYTTQDGAGEADGPPCESGGNQVLVTSRYVGYKFAPVRAGCAHFGIQAMERPAVEHFAHSWANAVNQELAADGRAELVTDQLIAEIYNKKRPKVRELATNPLLVTILATVYWRDGQLPDQRAGLYHSLVENLLRIWLSREECVAHKLTREELLAALEPLAAYMQENASSNGLIGLDRIGELMEGPIAQMRNSSPNDRRFIPVRDALLTTIQKHVGLLAEHSSGNYEFFHRTFQEFLAARHLLSQRAAAPTKISERIDEPLWREPLLLALGFAMVDERWGPDAREDLLTKVLVSDGDDALIPKAALMLVTALPDLQKTPRKVVTQTVVQLLNSYAISHEQTKARSLREQIERAFVRLRDGRQSDTVSCQLVASIRRPTGGRELAGAVAAILVKTRWFSTELVESLLLAVDRDRAELEWPIHRALMIALGSCPVSTPAPAFNATRLLGTHLPMRKLLETIPELVAFITNDEDWLGLLIALYGGLADLHWLQQMEQSLTKTVTAETPNAVVIESDGHALPSPPALEFSPQDIVHDLHDKDLSRLIQRQLRARKPARELMDTLRHRWGSGSDPVASAEALMGLMALGEDVHPLLKEASTLPELQPAVHCAFTRFAWLKTLLSEPLVQTVELALRTIPEEAPEQHQLDLLRAALAAAAASGGSSVEVSDRIPERRFVAADSPDVRNALEAEYWSYLCSNAGNGWDGVAFSSVADRVTSSVECLVHSWALLPEARNHMAARGLSWPQPILAPRSDSLIDRYLAMLDQMLSVPRKRQYIAGYVLGACRKIVLENPSLTWETLAVCWNQGEEFRKGYLYAFQNCGGQQTTSMYATPWEGEAAPHIIFGGLDDPTYYQVLVCLTHHDMPDAATSSSARFDCFERITRIAIPILRFRAQSWFMGTFLTGDDKPVEDPVKLIDRIPNAHDRIRAFEWMLMTVPTELELKNQTDLLEPILETLPQIADPENRARAQARIAFLASDQVDLLLSAIDSVACIRDAKRKAETIREIRVAWGQIPRIAESLDVVSEAIPDTWERDKAFGRTSRLVQRYRTEFALGSMAWRLSTDTVQAARVFRGPRSNYLAWTIIYLRTTAMEVESLGTGSESDESQWDRLLEKDLQAAVYDLVATGQEQGIPVSAREASVLDRILQTDRRMDLEGLWPYLERPSPGAMGTIARWVTRHDQAGNWSALVQAESGRLTPEVVVSVIDLLDASADRTRHRAALALHGTYPYTSNHNRNRRWSVRRIGNEVVEAVARCATEPTSSPGKVTTLNCFHSNLHHDDPKALEHWLEQAAANNQQTPWACWILSHMQSADAKLLPLLIREIASGPPVRQHALLAGLARLASCSHNFKVEANDIQSKLAAISTELRASIKVPPQGAVTVLGVIIEADRNPHSGDRLQEARRRLEAKLIWLEDDKANVEQLKKIGHQLYIKFGERSDTSSYWGATDKVAAPLAENAEALKLLVNWVSSLDLASDSTGYAHHILTATEAVARVSPIAFAVLASPDYWESLLCDWACYGNHWTARMAAIRLLGLLRRVTPQVTRALRSAMYDEPLVQQAAYLSVSEFRRIEGDILPELLELLDDPNASVVAATTQLLVNMARSEITSAQRRQILAKLKEAASRPSSVRPVYLMSTSTSSFHWSIQFIDRLDQILYVAIFEVSGL